MVGEDLFQRVGAIRLALEYLCPVVAKGLRDAGLVLEELAVVHDNCGDLNLFVPRDPRSGPARARGPRFRVR